MTLLAWPSSMPRKNTHTHTHTHTHLTHPLSATNALERLFYSALMLYGILVFGNLLSELAELNHAARSEELTKMESVQAAVDFMAGHDVPFSLNNEVLRWTRFHHAHSTSNVKKKDFLDRLPKNLQAELVTIVFGDVLTKVPLFDMLQEEDHSFLMEVSDCVQSNV